MELEEMGVAFNFLAKYRFVEMKPDGRRFRPDEKEIALMLYRNRNSLDEFNAFLSGMGFELIERDDATNGVARGTRVWFMARTDEQPINSFFTSENIFSELKIKDKDNRESVGLWYLHIWLIFLSLSYTRIGRSVSEVGSYVEAIFSKAKLQETVHEHIEKLRNLELDESDKEALRVVSILTDEQGQDINRRVNAFIQIAVNSGLLEDKGKDEYQQSLLCAYELDAHYGRSLQPIAENLLAKIKEITATEENKEEQ